MIHSHIVLLQQHDYHIGFNVAQVPDNYHKIKIIAGQMG